MHAKETDNHVPRFWTVREWPRLSKNDLILRGIDLTCTPYRLESEAQPIVTV